MKRFFVVLGILLVCVAIGSIATLTYLGRAMPYRFRDLQALQTSRDSEGALVVRFTPPPEMATRPALATFELKDKKIQLVLSRRATVAFDWANLRSLAATGSRFESVPRYDAASQSYVTAAPPFHGANAPFVYVDETGEHPFQ